jgi:four helix bundle protein
MRIERFEDIKSWQEARKLTAEIYRVTQSKSFAKDFGLRDQIQRAAVSIMANIAEGFGRKGNKEFLYFLNVAKGSALEVQSHLYAALDLGYIDQSRFDTVYHLANSVSHLIGGFINYLQKLENRKPKN